MDKLSLQQRISDWTDYIGNEESYKYLIKATKVNPMEYKHDFQRLMVLDNPIMEREQNQHIFRQKYFAMFEHYIMKQKEAVK